MFVITGATGNVGRHLVAELLTRGHRVRAVTRDPAAARLPSEAEAVPFDALPLDGATALFVNPAAFWGGLGDLLERAVEERVRRVVLLSSSAALGGGGPGNPIGAHHLDLEERVAATGLEWTFVRPGAFAANTLGWAGQIRADGVVRGPYARAAIASIHERDIAAVAARALADDDLVGAKPVLTGPRALTHAEHARLIGEAIGRPVRYEEISPGAARAAMTAGRTPPAIADALLRMFAAQVDAPGETSPAVEQIAGRPARPFAAWAADHAGDFR
ncbi:NAD(P)H-binding protein [Actinomadura parmotrematis]|uniref:NAD(P)H-binding protein n=1 Tax=Actinomadura parmotrematis TaxID=2864039 RepID=A0ABS7FUA8_9ACTN|nr:NAD(P)H-binding protein [Actinomadura parmotrematis]MBW8483881.1 NAD(P)H-binding protein [Actinomadura parmotrematis]